MSGPTINKPKCTDDPYFSNNSNYLETIADLPNQGIQLIQSASKNIKKLIESSQAEKLIENDQAWQQLSQGLSSILDTGRQWLSHAATASPQSEPKAGTKAAQATNTTTAARQTAPKDDSSSSAKIGLALGGTALVLGAAWTLFTAGSAATATTAAVGLGALVSRAGPALRWLAGSAALSSSIGIGSELAVQVFGGVSSLVSAGRIGLEIIVGAIGEQVISGIGELVLASENSVANAEPVQKSAPLDEGESPEDQRRLLIQGFFREKLQIDLGPDLRYQGMDFSFMLEGAETLAVKLAMMAGILDHIRLVLTEKTASSFNAQQINDIVRDCFLKATLGSGMNNELLVKTLERKENTYRKAAWLFQQFQSDPRKKMLPTLGLPPSNLFKTCLEKANDPDETLIQLKAHYQILDYVFQAAHEIGLEDSEIESLFAASLHDTDAGILPLVRHFEGLIFDAILEASPETIIDDVDINHQRVGLLSAKNLRKTKQAWDNLASVIKYVYLDKVFYDDQYNDYSFSFSDLDGKYDVLILQTLQNPKNIREYYRQVEPLKGAVGQYVSAHSPKTILTTALRKSPHSMDALLAQIHILYSTNVAPLMRPKR